jgi:glycosyltransferase involved in cell wall biosynthesis
VRVGLVATFAFWKGHEVFLAAAARVLAQNPGVPIRFYIIGGALYATPGSQHSLEDLRGHAARLGLEVGFTGFVEKPAAAMRALDIVVHASTQPEPFGLVIIQAMACGRALIASEAGGARELVDPGVDGLFHQPGDEASLAAAMVELAEDAALRERLGSAGRLKALALFNRSTMAERIVPLYEGLLA